MDVVNLPTEEEERRPRQKGQSEPVAWPVPLARITTCGGLKLEVLQRAHSSAHPDGHHPPDPVYGPSDATLLAKKGASTALLLLALLASQPAGFATKDFLSEHLRHVPKDRDEEEERDGLKRVDNVVCDLRHLLFPPLPDEEAQDRLLRRRLIAYQRASQQSGPGYQLAGLPLVWLDVEAIGAYMKQARALEQFGEDGLAEWRAAYELASRGLFLPGEIYSDWASARREAIEGHLWDCVQVLWRRVAEQGEAGQSEAIGLLRRYWQAHKTCEDALRPLLELLGKRECFGEAETYYQQLCQELQEEGKQPDRRTREVMEFLRALQIQRKPTVVESRNGRSNGSPVSPLLAQQLAFSPSPLPQAVAQDRMEQARATEGDFMDQLRRQFLHQTLQGTGVALLASHDLAFGRELAERLTKALVRPSSLDETTLRYLARHTATYWQDRYSACIASPDLFWYVTTHLEHIIVLLEESLLPAVRRQLCLIASQAALLVGEILFDMSDYAAARKFFNAALQAAREAGHQELEAIAWGWMSFLWSYSGNAQEARSCVQHARLVAAHDAHPSVRAWLAAIEAEIQANLGDLLACRQALACAEVVDKPAAQEIAYWIHFDRSLLASYKGVCLQRLFHPEEKRTQPLLAESESAFQEALRLLDPTVSFRETIVQVDLAGTYARQGRMEEACATARQAVERTMQTKSLMVVQRLLSLRGELERWKETAPVQAFDEQFRPVLLTIQRGKA